MRFLDLDMDYFIKSDIHIGSDSLTERLSEEDYGINVWSEQEVRYFFENKVPIVLFVPCKFCIGQEIFCNVLINWHTDS